MLFNPPVPYLHRERTAAGFLKRSRRRYSLWHGFPQETTGFTVWEAGLEDVSLQSSDPQWVSHSTSWPLSRTVLTRCQGLPPSVSRDQGGHVHSDRFSIPISPT